eukprot:gnl/MRDRNA2_/MRDRNA2_31950_c0_seq1.p1 gnl/MRDRNA2_/MRDRNA2_31950_c0~~gnl/MRDRNA2_/MRDRNA2_31950_c0_seq1.p1  ORF type:complete len:290 (+),score=43.07 gnl/MRDRNA2_/MRDRNA2_31950_c0_seq1:98-967(+)
MKTLCCAFLVALAQAFNIPTREVAPGVDMPVMSIGSGQLGSFAKHAPASEIVGAWLDLGGRGIDTAWMYRDQAEIAETIKRHGVARKDLFITSKLLECVTGAEHYIEDDLKQLNTTYIDLMLIHAPVGNCAETWSVMEDYHSRGVLRAIGVSNFNQRNLEGLLKSVKIMPAVNQIEYNLYSHDEDTIQYCRGKNITVEAYSPLGSWTPHHSKSIFADPTVKTIAASHNVSAAQVALKWIVQRGDILTVLSANKTHQANDADLFDPRFRLSDSEMNHLDELADKIDNVLV